MRTRHGETRMHNGIDIAAVRGTPVRAAQWSRVLRAVPNGGWSGYGNVVVLAGSDGRATLYAHLDRFTVREGEAVAKGEVLGFVGATEAGATHEGGIAPHLHFEVHAEPTVNVNPENPRRLDPLTYLAAVNLSVAGERMP